MPCDVKHFLMSSQPSKHPVVRILELSLNKFKKELTLRGKLGLLIESVGFRDFTKAELGDIEMMLGQGQLLSAIDKKYRFPLPLCVNELEDICHTGGKKSPLLAYFVLQSCISFLIAIENDKSAFRWLTLILTSLLAVLDNTELTDLIAKTFVYIVSIAARHSIDLNYEEVFGAVVSLFHAITTWDEDFTTMLISLLRSLMCATHGEMTQDVCDLLGFITQFVREFPQLWSTENSSDVLEMFVGRLMLLDSQVLVFLNQMGDVFHVSEMSNFVCLFPEFLLTFIQEQPVFNAFPELLGETVGVVFSQEQSFHIEFFEGEAIDDEFFHDRGQFCEPCRLLDLLPEEAGTKISMLGSLSQLCGKSMELLPTVFATMLGRNEVSEHFVDLCIGSLIACQCADANAITPLILYLCHSKLFDDRLSIFKEDLNDCEKSLLMVRSYVFELMINEVPICLQELLASKEFKPIAIAELCTLFARKLNGNHRSVLGSVHFAKLLCDIYNGYRLLWYSEEMNTKEVKLARKALVFLISAIMENEELSDCWSESSFLSSMILSEIYEIPLRHYFLNKFQIVWAKKPLRDSSVAMQFLFGIFASFGTKNTDERYIQLIGDLLSTFRSVLQSTMSIIGVCVDIYGIVATYLPILTPGSVSRYCLCEIISFMAALTPKRTWSNDNLESIYVSITTIDGGEPSDEIDSAVFKFLAGGIPVTGNDFSIKQPYGLRLYVRIYEISEKLPRVLGKLNELASFSRENAISFHEGNLDIQLLDILEAHKQDETNIIIEPALNLLARIASCISSTKVLLKYIELFCPIHSRFVSRWHHQFIRTLTDIVTSKSRVPKGFIPLKNHSPFLDVSNVNSLSLQHGFSVIMWMYMDCVVQNQKMVAVISDMKGRFVNIYLFPSAIIVEVKSCSEKEKKEYTLPVTYPRGSWFLVTVSYLNLCGQWKVTASVNLSFSNTDCAEPIEFDKQIKCSFGNLDSALDYCGQLGPVGIISNDAVSLLPEIVQTGPRKIPPCDYVFYIDMPISNGTVVPYKAEKSVNCVVTLNGPKVMHSYALVDVLIQFFKIDVILPLFAQLDLRYLGGKETDSMALDIMELLFSVLSMTQKGQHDFSQSSGFRIVSHLLRKSNPKHLTLELYAKILAMYNKLDNLRLKRLIFDTLLMNFDLWAHANPQIQVSIAENWSKYLVPNCEEFITRLRPVQYILAVLRIFYYYEPVERDFICMDRPDIPVETIRNLLEVMLDCEYDAQDMISLVGHIVSCKDASQVLHLLRFIQKTCGNGLFKKSKYLTCLDLLMGSSNEDIILEGFKTIAILHEQKCYEKLGFLVHMFSLSNRISFEAFSSSETFLQKLLDLATQIPVTITACFRAVFHGLSWHTLVEYLKPSKKYCVCRTWMFWPIVAALKIEGAFLGFIMEFIVASHDGDWWDIFEMINVVAKAMSVDGSDCICVFLKLLANSLLIGNDSFGGPSFTQFFAMTELFLLFRPLNCVNLALEFAYSESCFGSSNPSTEQETTKNVEIAEDILLNRVQTVSDSTEQIRFGLRFDKSGEWIDADLAVSYIRLALKSNSNEAINMAALLCSYAMHDREAITSPYIPLLVKSSLLSENMISLLTKGQSLSYDYFCQLTKSNTAVLASLKKVEVVLRTEATRLFNPKPVNVRKDIILHSLQQMELCRDRICNLDFQKNKEWHRLWGQLTFDLAPWNKAVALHRGHYWKRDNCLCGAGCPIKLKINVNHDDHRYASFRRDTGSRTVAETMLADYRKQQQPEEAPSELLQLSNSKSHDETVSLPSSHRPKVNVEGWLITVKKSRKCKVLIIGKDIHIMIGTMKDITIKYEEIGRIAFRPVMHRPTGLEIFLKIGRSYLLNLPRYNSLSVLNALPDIASFSKGMIQTARPTAYLNNKKLVEKWMRGEISNFEYLLALNDISGRSYHDGSMYPVMPWVIQNFECETLDLNDPSVFRDLSKPMGAMDDARLALLQKKMDGMMESGSVSTPYLYGSGYVSPLTLFSWLIRMEPFTTLHIETQSGKFDHASRIFSSISNSFRMATRNSNDYVELIPEFYCSPSFLTNLNDLDLGVINQKRIGDVELPKWAHTAVEFVYKMREALESPYVSEHLCEWIDLIWGWRQTGDRLNAFHPYMYASAWTRESEKDPSQASAIEAIMKECGQIPVQLFTSPHPKRNISVSDGPISSLIRIPSKIPVTNASLSKVRKDELEFFVVAEGNRVISRVTFSFSSTHNVSRKNFSLKLDESDANTIQIHDECVIMASITGEIDVVDLFTLERAHFVAHMGPVNCVSADENYLITGGGDTATNVYFNNKMFPLAFAVPSYRGSVKACAVSSTFAVVVSGTDDGSILIFSITSHAIVHVLKTETRIPEKILVSPDWGFVVVYEVEVKMGQTTRYIEVFTIDGMFVSRKQIPFSVTAWCSLSNGSGRDYVVLSDQRGRIYLFEVFYLDITEPFYRNAEDVIFLEYVKPLKSVTAMSSAGTCFVLPLHLK